ncbi:MAG TPA: GGDEF domain-containing protein, partial [Candidatus Bathyarchaeia archaeon]|nr:GGDEF domain-containing protein [Candidatus Bathyarchaeia archaeon]
EDLLAHGERIELIRAAYLAMEELAAGGSFVSEGVGRENGNVSISYRASDQPEKITLVMTSAEWDAAMGTRHPTGGILPSVFAGIISSLSLNDSPKTIVARIEEMLSLAGKIAEGARAKLLFVNTIPAIREWSPDTVAFLPLSEALKRRFYHSCLTSGAPHAFLRLTGDTGGGGAFTIIPGTKSILMIPLAARDVRWAILEMHLRGVSPLDEGTLSNFHILGQGIVRLLENNTHFERMVSTDRLTQVHNRNYYELQVPLEIERANRNRMSLGFLIIDIDDFKKVNDGYGHDVGDRVLRLVAQTVRRSLRKIDLLFRYGGEEFIVLLPGTGADSARRTAERIRGIVARVDHALEDGRKVKVTISIGGSIYPAQAQNESQLFRMADKALYAAKEEGKNRVVFSGD